MTLDDLRLNLDTINNHHEAARKVIADEALKAIRELEADRDNWRKQALDEDSTYGDRMFKAGAVIGEMRRVYDGRDPKYASIDRVVNDYINRLCAALEITVKADEEDA